MARNILDLKPKNLKAALPEIRAVVSASKRLDVITIPVSQVDSVGKRLVSLAEAMPDIWDTTLDVVAYRTSLNASLAAVGTAQQIATTRIDHALQTHYQIYAPKGYSTPIISVGGDVPEGQAANMYVIGAAPPDEGQTRGKQVILMEGGAIGLDGQAWKHVVARNTRVVYEGDDPTELEDVVFVNCTFVLKNTPAARAFANALLSNSTVNFNSRFQATHQ
jgi:hypothetical protein